MHKWPILQLQLQLLPQRRWWKSPWAKSFIVGRTHPASHRGADKVSWLTEGRELRNLREQLRLSEQKCSFLRHQVEALQQQAPAATFTALLVLLLPLPHPLT
ncbi:unnamed protein product [Polarella glacialis]|uniref:Uncharacterized protein n=1 Tax=Polarella glacialis TaxID=89957 RepID=A0A813F972_POLGL|nr:unnamed protein product [Polarella glacialis]